MSADILGTSWDQCRSMVQYGFTSTETRRLVRTDSPGRPPRLSHSSWTMGVCEPVFPRLMQAGVLFFRWWLRRFEFQPARVAVEGRSNVVRNTHAARLQTSPATILAYCTRPVSGHLAMACVGCSLFWQFFNLFAQSKTTTKSHESYVFLCPFSDNNDF